MNEGLISTLQTYCYLVERGKPCAMFPIQKKHTQEVMDYIEKVANVKTFIEELSEGWKTIWIYKDEYMIEIIKMLPEQPKTIFEHWLLGKAFGYSDDSIRDFIETKVFYK